MKTNKKISRKNLPKKIPVNHALICILIIKAFDTPEWLKTLIILWIILSISVSITLIIKDKEIDLFEKEKSEPKKSFDERIKERMQNDQH
jgi:hypothetical protein